MQVSSGFRFENDKDSRHHLVFLCHSQLVGFERFKHLKTLSNSFSYLDLYCVASAHTVYNRTCRLLVNMVYVLRRSRHNYSNVAQVTAYSNLFLFRTLFNFVRCRPYEIKRTNIFNNEIFTRVSYTIWGAYEIKTAQNINIRNIFNVKI